MKKFVLYVLVSFISVLCFSSCSDQEEIVYSCDDNINSWVKENITEIRDMNRTAWKTLPSSKKRAAFVALTPQRKMDFWKEKLTDLMSLDWTNEELDHIKLAYDFIVEHPDFFNDSGLTDEQLNTLDLFFYKWSEIAQKKLNWDVTLIYAMVASGDDVVVKTLKNGIKSSFVPDINIGASDKECHCNVKMLSDFCGVTSQGECEDVTCVGSDLGCGWILLEDCNGRCSGVY